MNSCASFEFFELKHQLDGSQIRDGEEMLMKYSILAHLCWSSVDKDLQPMQQGPQHIQPVQKRSHAEADCVVQKA